MFKPCPLVKQLLLQNGFLEAPEGDPHWNVSWTGGRPATELFQRLTPYQKVNHFPGTGAVTQKDALAKNIQMMQHRFGLQHFNFIPQTFSLPTQMTQLEELLTFEQSMEDSIWLMKPVNLSRGRGIQLFTSANWKQKLDNRAHPKVIVSRYIPNPLLINGYKFDLRLYVVVTSWNPLRIYLYREGLARFATEKYNLNQKSVSNVFMHLTNYAVNKNNVGFVKNNGDGTDTNASKWSLTALKQYLHDNSVNVDRLMSNIKDVLVKTFLSGDPIISRHVAENMPYRGNCFELFGFDVLIDQNLHPWLIEVNLSPSLSCDALLDLRIKSNLLADIYNMVGVQPFNFGQMKERIVESKMPKTPSEMEDEIVTETEEEFSRVKNFDVLYPTADSRVYDDFFIRKKRMNDLMIDRLIRDEQARTLGKIVSTSPLSSRTSATPTSPSSSSTKVGANYL
jgi:tubulin polyglutamylase TTLL5